MHHVKHASVANGGGTHGALVDVRSLQLWNVGDVNRVLHGSERTRCPLQLKLLTNQ